VPGDNSAFIYVATTGSDSATCGASEATACQTLQQGVNRCAGTRNCIVVARHGIYSVAAPVTVSNSMQLFGSCSFNGEKPNRYRTIVRGLPVFSIAANGGNVQIAGFTILANDAAPGNASIALTVDSSVLVLDQNMIVSGVGGPGERGVDAADSKQANNGKGVPTGSTAGGLGGPGVACADPGRGMSGYGGSGAQNHIVYSSGGYWNTACKSVNSPAAQTGGNAGSANGGGGGGNGSPGCDCIDGATGNTPDGDPGVPGAPGAASATGGTTSSDVLGQFSGLNWSPGAGGSSGSWGLPGAGGGGGGAGGFASVEIPGTGHLDYEGQPGGGGGSGGCGGLGGTGGTPGGGSFPIVARASYLQGADANVIVPGPGGTGGRGGKGGSGSAGGSGGGGATGHQTLIKGWNEACQGTAPGSGGPGNSGGAGGAGSGGAGGNGGPSFAVVLLQPPSQPLPTGTYYTAQPGVGGPAGDAGGGNDTAAPAKAGLAGGSGQMHTFAAVGAGCCTEEPPPKKHKRAPPKRRHHPPRSHEHDRGK
jgi:hypothetical protein